ncbi:uncharacterized protein MKZ38_007149 [Zalerion maritima]|uniref:DNA-directed RNA polymerases I and III subunit RPAC1 n=1 Tax=Zalerion maritima TaxID=339359 RepID=A0AAD5WVL1_9PEZI|nr:uncharacterized protein MKZ38_007149 [Zalerion maritima]
MAREINWKQPSEEELQKRLSFQSGGAELDSSLLLQYSPRNKKLTLLSSQTVSVNSETVTNITNTLYPYHWPGENHAWDINAFRDGLDVQFHHNAPLECSFSLLGVDASIANAIRRILIAEIPTLAIEHVLVEDNSSVVVDEVLSHRLGLIPFKGGKRGLQDFLKWWKPGKPDALGYTDPFSTTFDYNTVKLVLNIECTHNDDADPNETDPRKKYNHAHVYAKDLEFVPLGRQSLFFSGEDAIAPFNPDILIAKMRPGQRIDLECHMHKGIGADHAKFSPVATASYRLLPKIDITAPIVGADAEKFARCFPPGVIGFEKVPKALAKRKHVAGRVSREGMPVESQAYKKEGEKMAVVKNPMKDTVSRECLRHEEFKEKVKLGRQMDHFIFSVESTGQWDADELVLEALKTLKQKAIKMQEQVQNMITG